MRRAALLAIAAAAIALPAVFAVPGASAAVEVGNNCTAEEEEANVTAVQIGRKSASSSPVEVPEAGVVTAWRVNVVLTPKTFQTQFKVMRNVGGVKFNVVGESAVETVAGGINIFKTRIPVQPGDRFGTGAGPGGRVLLCKTANSGDVIGRVAGNAAVNTSPDFSTQEASAEVAVTGIVEADADHDGYGDETQDECPVSAALQTPCPTVSSQAIPIVRKGSLLVLVTATGRATVTISGTVKLPGSSGAHAAAQVKLAPVIRSVKPPKITRFLLPFPKRLKGALAALPRGKSLPLKLKSTIDDGAREPTTSTATVKLR